MKFISKNKNFDFSFLKKKEDISINLLICLLDVIINIFTLLYAFKNI